MFAIYGGKQEFTQWDLDQLVTNPCMEEGSEVVFKSRGKTYETTAFLMDGEVVADVPNFLLQEPCDITVDLGWGLDVRMECRTVFNVVEREKPVDYCCEYNIKNRQNNSGGGGVNSWNDIPDKPFYKETVDVELASGEYTSDFDSAFGGYKIGLGYHEERTDVPETFTITFDGAVYDITQTVEFQGMGAMFGNLYYLNAILGTNYENTGEPFFGGISVFGIDLYLLDTEPTKHSVKFTAPSTIVHTISQDFIHIPAFDLDEMGLPHISETEVSITVDNFELYNALRKGFVRLEFTLGDANRLSAIANAVYHDSELACECVFFCWDFAICIRVGMRDINGLPKCEISACLKRLTFTT